MKERPHPHLVTSSIRTLRLCGERRAHDTCCSKSYKRGAFRTCGHLYRHCVSDAGLTAEAQRTRRRMLRSVMGRPAGGSADIVSSCHPVTLSPCHLSICSLRALRLCGESSGLGRITVSSRGISFARRQNQLLYGGSAGAGVCGIAFSFAATWDYDAVTAAQRSAAISKNLSAKKQRKSLLCREYRRIFANGGDRPAGKSLNTYVPPVRSIKKGDQQLPPGQGRRVGCGFGVNSRRRL